MILYHGSKEIVKQPLYGYGRIHNDYGQGFYCTQDPELAKEWACQDVNGGFANAYDFNEKKMRILDLTEYSQISWIALLLANRSIRYASPVEKKAAQYLTERFLPDTEGYDVITGYRADDSYFSYARAFLSNTISLQQLETAMQLGDLGIQVCLKSRRSFEEIRFLKAEPADGVVYYARYMHRDDFARESYYRLLEQTDADGLYIRDMIRKEMSADDFCV